MRLVEGSNGEPDTPHRDVFSRRGGRGNLEGADALPALVTRLDEAHPTAVEVDPALVRPWGGRPAEDRGPPIGQVVWTVGLHRESDDAARGVSWNVARPLGPGPPPGSSWRCPVDRDERAGHVAGMEVGARNVGLIRLEDDSHAEIGHSLSRGG